MIMISSLVLPIVCLPHYISPHTGYSLGRIVLDPVPDSGMIGEFTVDNSRIQWMDFTLE